MEKKSLYDSFNARNLAPKEIAKTFVPNEFFDRLRGNNHAVIMGPRGSGKTTMLKMLTLEALSSWEDEKAKIIISELPFVAVYIPTDIHWHRQLACSAEELQRFADHAQMQMPNVGKLFSAASVTTNILTALTLAMRDRLQYEINNNDLEQEAVLCREIFKGWMLPLEVPSLGALLQALKLRMSEIRKWHSMFIHADIGKPPEIPTFFHLDYLASADLACTAFDELFCKDKKLKWALCFDELEIAPAWLQDRLFLELRSTEEKFLFKLSTSPIPNFSETSKANVRNDYVLIQLWPHSRNDFSSFSEQLAMMVLKRRGIEVSPYEFFGASPFSDKFSKSDEYAENSLLWRTIKDQALKDPGLKKILELSGISPENPTTNDVKKRDSILRKMKPIVLHRAAYRRMNNAGDVAARSRKNVSELFHGFDVVSTMSEGNARWLIGTLEDMLLGAEKNATGQIVKISTETQGIALMRASEHFYTLIKSLPETKERINGQDVYLVDLLNDIAEYFFGEQVMGEFTLDPIGSFNVDPNAPSSLTKLLRIAAYHEAVILIDPDEAALDADLVGKRFRLGYMFAPYWGLPLRLYGETSLSKCLLGRNKKGQLDLIQ